MMGYVVQSDLCGITVSSKQSLLAANRSNSCTGIFDQKEKGKENKVYLF
jgi:hypothetical protein